MDHVWSDEVDEILSIGFSLETLGISNWGLGRQLALDALEKLFVSGVSVLGGDVYIFDGKTVNPTYDNWYCERQPGEDRREFANRSIEVAKKYISSYENRNDNVIFVMVPEV